MINTKKENLKITIYAVIAIVVVLMLFCGCGSRKTSKSETTEKVKTETIDNSKIETITDTNTRVIDCTSTEEITIVPIDNTLPIFVNGKAYKNVVLKRRKVKNNIVVDKVEKSSKKQQNNIKTTIKAKKSVEVKQTERKQFNIFSLWWLIPLFLLIYFGYKKRKELFL